MIRSILLILTALVLVPSLAAATDSTVVSVEGTVATATGQDASAPRHTAKDNSAAGLTYLVPELEGVGYRVSNGKRQFKDRIWFSPGFGQLGAQDLFAFRVGYNPNAWLGYEVTLGHNPAASLHALLHTFNVILRYPVPWRAQPYATFGFGMITVYPGQAINADPVSKNTITAGGGLELYIRDDVALRGELRSATVLGRERGSDGTVVYAYREYTLGFAFYRSLGR